MLFCFISTSGQTFGSSVSQSPAVVIGRPGQTCTLICSHKVSAYNTILWYYQLDQQMNFIGYSFHNTHNFENTAGEKFKLEGNGKSSVNLTIPSLKLNDSAVYFCGASAHNAIGSL